MADPKKMKYDMTPLVNLEKAITKMKGLRARVGILGNKAGRSDDVTNAEIGVKQEYGFVISEGEFEGATVPARSFLRMPFRHKIDFIQTMIKPVVEGLLGEGKVGQLMHDVGIAGEKLIHQAFQSSGWGTWAPNAPTTIRLKGSDMPLIDKGFLMRSISSKVVKAK